MATQAEIQLQQQGIQNSEILLDLSNQLNNSITERRKLLKNITAEEQSYFATVKQQQKLSSDIAANAEKYLGYQIKSKDLAKQIRAVEDNTAKSKKAFSNVSAILAADQQKAAKEARKLRIQERDLARQILAIDENTQDLEIQKQIALRRGRADVAQRIQQDIKSNQLNASALEKRSKKLEEEIAKQKNIAKATAETIKNGKETLKSQEKEITFLKENERIRKRIEKSTGLLGAMSKAASKLPGIGQYLNADEAIDEMEKLAAKIEEGGGKATSFGNRILIAKKGLNTLIKGAYENLKSPEAVFTFFLNAALTANDQAVKLGKSLGYGADRANDFREKLAGIERSSSNINVTTKNLVEAYGELAAATGLAYEFTDDQLVTQIKLTKQVGLTADEAAQVQRFAVLNNKTSEETYKSFLKGITASRNQLKVGIDFKATLTEAVKVSGQLAAQLGNNPELIGKAVVTAKALGMTLEQVAKAGSTLLDFGTSIGNELEAELLTGKQLNLERARAAALAGDQITLAEELAKNMGTAAEFTKLNKLQQDSLAKSIGMSSDELANTLRKREEAIASGKSLAQITEEEAKEALERQNVQDKFNAAIEKLQSLFGNLLAGPIGQLLDALSNVVVVAMKILSVFSPILNIVSGIAKFISDILSKWYVLYPLIGIVALGYMPKMLSAFSGIGASIKGMIGNLSKGGLASLFGGGGATKNASTITTSSGITLTKKASAAGPGNLTTAGNAANTATSAGGKAGASGPKAGEGIKNTLKGISAGIQSFKKVSVADIGKLALSALALVALTPAIPALLALQFINGKLIQSALEGTGKGLAAFGKAVSKSAGQILIGEALLAGLGLALMTFVPIVKAVGDVVSTIFTSIASGVSTVVGALGDMIVKLGEAGPSLLLLGPALFGIAGGLAAMGLSGILALPSIIALTALGTVAPALADIGIGGGGGGKEEGKSTEMTELIAAVKEVKAAVDKLYSKDQSINMDGKKVGTTLVQGSYKVA